jgi:transposase, IS30 family
LSLLLTKEYSLRDIAKTLVRSVSTLSEEVRRNRVKGVYDPKKAHQKATDRRRNASFRGKKIIRTTTLRRFVERALLGGQSPENIAGRIKKEGRYEPVSGATIRRFIASPYGRQIEAKRKMLKGKKRGRRGKSGTLTERTFIEQRPKRATNRTEVGHAEGDFIVSGKEGRGVLLVVVDRTSRRTYLEKIHPVTVSAVHQGFLVIQKRYPELLSLTLDNDILFQKHKELEELLSIPLYFCHPYHSWEKGTVERVNREIRKYIPKGSSIEKYTKKEVKVIEDTLNQRYLKCLGYATPREAHSKKRTA